MTMVNFRILGECSCGREIEGFQCAFGRVLITRIRVESSIYFFKPCACGNGHASQPGKPIRELKRWLEDDEAAKVEAIRTRLRERNTRRRKPVAA